MSKIITVTTVFFLAENVTAKHCEHFSQLLAEVAYVR
jgi:hypothetical protein